MRSSWTSVTRPYTPGSRVPRRFRFGPCSTRIFMAASLASVAAEGRDEPVGQREEHEPCEDRPAERRPTLAVHLGDQVRRRHVDGDARGERERVGDRKSTRLNSSHITISYAVFCLKKKKTNNEH